MKRNKPPKVADLALGAALTWRRGLRGAARSSALALRPQPGVRSGAEPPARLAALWEAAPKNGGAAPSGGGSSVGVPSGGKVRGGSLGPGGGCDLGF